MTDSMDEWDGGAIDGRDQYLADAPYWNGDGETVDGTDPNAAGQVTTENVPDPGDEPEIDDTDESETDEPEVPTWPPNSETLTELRRRLLNGESTENLGGAWTSASNGALYTAAVGDSFADVEADIPALKTVGNGQAATWVIDEDGETQSELSHEFRRNEPDGSWPPVAARIDDIRQRLVNGESSAKIAGEYSVGKDAIQEIAKGNTYNEHPAQEAAETPPVRYISQSEEWEWAEPDLETETADNDDPEPETETADSEEDREPETEQQESGLVSGDERPVARNPPEPETPTVPTRWLVAGVAFVAGWVLSRLLRGGDD